LNTIHYMGIDDLLLSTIDVQYHPTVMASAGDLAVSAASAVQAVPGYVLVVEGAVPVGEAGAYCYVWTGMTMANALALYAPDAAVILAVGTCAAFGGIPGGSPNPTSAQSVEQVLGPLPNLINIPGCPSHPDWIVGSIAHILATGQIPPLDEHRRPKAFFKHKVHDHCPIRDSALNGGDASVFPPQATQLGEGGCLHSLGCRGACAHADCPSRRWNAAAVGEYGINSCTMAGAPCQACTEPGFPDAMSPFFTL
jgi:hydrogenase small subunit